MQFSTEFWNEIPGVFNGPSIVLEKIKLSTVIMEQYTDFFKQITTGMETFSQTIEKATKLPMSRDSDKMMASEQTMMDEFRKMARNFREAAKTINGEMTKIAEFNRSSVSTRKNAREAFKNVQDELTDSIKKTNTYQKTALIKYKELRKSKEICDAIENKPGIKSTALDKSIQNRIKCDENFHTAEAMYRDSLPALNTNFRKYKTISSEQFKKLQDLEENRITFFRGNMWIISNIFAQLAVLVDDHMEVWQTSLKNVEVDNEILAWIASNRTGQEFPRFFVYRPTNETEANVEPSAISEENDELKPIRKGYGAFNFVARSDSEACITRGEKVKVIHEEKSDWILIRKLNGEEGFVPKKYVANKK